MKFVDDSGPVDLTPRGPTLANAGGPINIKQKMVMPMTPPSGTRLNRDSADPGLNTVTSILAAAWQQPRSPSDPAQSDAHFSVPCAILPRRVPEYERTVPVT